MSGIAKASELEAKWTLKRSVKLKGRQRLPIIEGNLAVYAEEVVIEVHDGHACMGQHDQVVAIGKTNLHNVLHEGEQVPLTHSRLPLRVLHAHLIRHIPQRVVF